MARKNRMIILVLVVLMIIFGAVMVLKDGKERFPSGKDTVESFGDGTFQILRGYVDNKQVDSLFNYNMDILEQVVEKNIKNYKVKDRMLYVLGDEGYTRINIQTYEVKKSKSLDDFNHEDAKIFENIK
ncbi:hypothetical protein [Paenibacillus chitinolyticus]|uniref:hypothetical protein n=1 Tax=Paenibacillus chitinolyticus TaxID=79263 RepID=UPI00366B576F